MTGGQRALLLGAGSQIAPFLSRKLATLGWSGVAVSRNPPPPLPPLDPAFVWRALDVTSSSGPPWGTWDAVVSLVPLWRLPPHLPNIQGFSSIVAFSSTSVVTKAASRDPAERELADSLAAAERSLLAGCQASNIACTLLRPTLVYGCGRDRTLSAIAGFIRRHGVFPVLYPGKGLRQPVHAEDLAAAAVACLQRPTSQGMKLDLPGGETLTFREMVERVFLTLKRRPLILPIPPRLLSLGGRWIRHLLPFGYSLEVLERMNVNQCFDVTPAFNALGYRPRPLCLGVHELGGMGTASPIEG